ncbi:hypothetical protein [Streptomyces sp. NPDC060194]|uniref:hypothetical protein n=1 Tax=Streptomyces sp. NPDC060194 TaxID=3347069 RepID=UPI003655B2BC
MNVVVQRVRTSWTKASRGGPGAAVRNAAPIAFAVPLGLGSGLHEVVLAEADGFVPQMTEGELSDAGLQLREADGLLRVRPPELARMTAPRRDRRPPSVRLAPGQWLRWQINYRFGGGWSDTWTYRLDTLNIAYGPTSADVFLTTPPTRTVDERGFLR